MADYDKNAFLSEWKDWKLRTLLLDHYIYWQGDRMGKDKKIESLKRFLTQHSTAKTGSNVEFMLDFYGDRCGIFLSPQNPSPESGYINPLAKNDIDKVLYAEYNLRRTVHGGYTLGELLWNVYTDYDEEHHIHRGAVHMAQSFKNIFSNLLNGYAIVNISTSDEGTKDEEDYLKITWKNDANNYVWWMGFLAGGFLKKEDASAQGLVRSSAFQIQQFDDGTKYFEQYWSLCAPDFGNKARHSAKTLNGPLGANVSYNLITTISLVKFITWFDNQIDQGTDVSKIMDNLMFFFQDQDCPISTSKGIAHIESRLLNN